MRSAFNVHDALMYPKTDARFGTPENITPLYDNVFEKSTLVPSTLTSMPPKTSNTRPVAVTMMSAWSSFPDFS